MMLHSYILNAHHMSIVCKKHKHAVDGAGDDARIVQRDEKIRNPDGFKR